MVPKDQDRFMSRWPYVKALKDRVRHLLPARLGHRKLKMPVLETDRLVLRRFNQADLGDIIAWEESSGGQSPEAEARQFLDYCFREYRDGSAGPWGMELKESGVIVGNCGFSDIVFEKQCGEVNYYVAPRHRGKGLALEALKTLMQFGFRDIGLTRIQARCEVDNLSSERVMQKAGLRFEGLIEAVPSSKDPAAKQKLYAILEKDFHP